MVMWDVPNVWPGAFVGTCTNNHFPNCPHNDGSYIQDLLTSVLVLNHTYLSVCPMPSFESRELRSPTPHAHTIQHHDRHDTLHNYTD
jgi:hypothetical protein